MAGTASGAAIRIFHGMAFSPGNRTGRLPSRSIAFMLCGRHGAAIGGPPHFIYCAMNMFFEPLEFTLPVLPKGAGWYRFVDTARDAPDDMVEPGAEVHLGGEKVLAVGDRAIVILIGR